MSVLPLQLGGLWAGGFGPLRLSDEQPAPGPKRTIRQPGNAADRAVSNRAAAERSTLEELSDERLLEAYLHGDRSAFTRLMGRYSNELLHFLTRFLGSRAAADDVFQETFLQIHLSADTFDIERRFKPWLFTIAANKARDYHRKHNRAGTMSLSASIDSSGEGDRFVDLLQSDVADPDMPLLDAERSRLVKGVVDSLPAHLREILLLSYFQRLSYNQIAEALEIPLGTVKSRLHTAVAAFARAWSIARGEESEDAQLEDERVDRRPDGKIT